MPSILDLAAIRSQRATGALALLKSMAKALDRTPWIRTDRTSVLASETFVEPFLIAENTRKRQATNFQERDDRREQSIFTEHESPLYKPSRPAPDRAHVRWCQALRTARRTVLKGAPGGGKTFMARHAVRELLLEAHANLDSRDVALDRLPASLFVTATALARAKAPNAISALVTAGTANLAVATAVNRAWLREALQSRESFVVIDALDEVPTRLRGIFLARAAELLELDIRLLVTCRTMAWEGWAHDLLGANIQELEIAPLSAHQQRQAVRRFFRDQDAPASALQRLLQATYELRQACRTPLPLTFACLLHEDGWITPNTTRAELYGRMVRKLLEGKWRGNGCDAPLWANDSVRTAAAVEALEAIAWRLFTNEPASNWFTWSHWRRATDKTLAEVGLSSRQFLTNLTQLGLVIGAPADELGNERWSFTHRAIFEYLAARGLARQPRTAWLAEASRHFWFEPEWIEVLTHLAAVVEDATPLIDAVVEAEHDDDPFGSMLYLRARVVGAASHCSKEQTESIVRALLNRCVSTLQGPGHAFHKWTVQMFSSVSAKSFVSDALAATLISWIRDNSARGQGESRSSLGAMGGLSALDPLYSRLWALDESVRSSVAEVLGALGNRRAVEPLVAWLRDEPGYAALSMAKALGAIGDPRAFDALLLRLNETEDPGCASVITEALAGIAEAPTILLLLRFLNENPAAMLPVGDPWPRLPIVDALAAMGDPRAVDPLLRRLCEEPNAWVRLRIARALAALGDPRAVDTLLLWLREESDDLVRSNIVEAVGAFAHPGSVDELLLRLSAEPDCWVRWDIAEAIGVIGEPHAVDPLLLRLREEADGAARTGIANALGALGDPRAVDVLLCHLGAEPDVNVQRSLALALGAIGDRRAVDALLLRLGEEVEVDLRRDLAHALGNIGDPRAVDLLVRLHDDPDVRLRIEIAWALGNIADPRAVPPLVLRLSKEPNPEVRIHIAAALGAIGDRRAIDALCVRLRREPADQSESGLHHAVRVASANALWQLATRHRIRIRTTDCVAGAS